MAHAHQQGRTLQWMRSAPKDPNATRGRNLDHANMDSGFSSHSGSSTHFQVLDDDGLAVQQQRIDDAARRLISRRRNGPVKAWGAPAKSEQDYRRSLMPRSPRGRSSAAEPKQVSPQRYGHLSPEDSDALNYAFIPETERLARANAAASARRPHTASAGGRNQQARPNSGLETIPSDFQDKLHIMRNNSAAKTEDLEEKYEAERSGESPTARRQNPKSPVKKWTKAVREAFVEDHHRDGSAEKTRQRQRRPRTSVPPRKKPNTIPKPFAGVEARSTIKTMSRSMERTMADLAEKELAEAEAANYKWHAKPVPRAVKENRYQAILDKAEATRIKEGTARKQRLQETLKPFPGLEQREKAAARKKIAKEEKKLADAAAAKVEAKRKKEKSARAFRQASARSAAGEQDRGAAEVERRARVQRRAAKLLHSAKMPARMEMWIKTQKQNASTKDEATNGHSDGLQHRMKLNKISSLSSGDIRKHFERSQLKFKKSLQQARQSRPKAASRPFAFMSDERKRQEDERRKKTEARLARQAEKEILEKTKKERRQKELAKKLKGMSHVSVLVCCCFCLFFFHHFPPGGAACSCCLLLRYFFACVSRSLFSPIFPLFLSSHTHSYILPTHTAANSSSN